MEEKFKIIKEIFEELKDQLNGKNDFDILKFIIKNYASKTAYSTSFNLEAQVITHILSILDKKREIFIFTIDTGRLFEETYDLINITEKFFNININVFFPDNKLVENMVKQHGINLFFKSVKLRKLCCFVRKLEPMKRALRDKFIWITGIRKEQSDYRKNFSKIMIDRKFNVIKINPILDWNEQDVWNYINRYNLPINKLFLEGYSSVGCQPCTIKRQNMNIRSGRWWWENDEFKECGLHT